MEDRRTEGWKDNPYSQTQLTLKPVDVSVTRRTEGLNQTLPPESCDIFRGVSASGRRGGRRQRKPLRSALPLLGFCF